MESTVSVVIVFSSLLAGSLFGAGANIKHSRDYQGFIENASNYYLVDDDGEPVSQESK